MVDWVGRVRTEVVKRRRARVVLEKRIFVDGNGKAKLISGGGMFMEGFAVIVK